MDGVGGDVGVEQALAIEVLGISFATGELEDQGAYALVDDTDSRCELGAESFEVDAARYVKPAYAGTSVSFPMGQSTLRLDATWSEEAAVKPLT